MQCPNCKIYITPERSSKQNNSLHKFCSLLAEQLNNAGLDMTKILRFNIPWTTHSVKDYIWKPVMRSMTGKKSTTKLSKSGEINLIHETIMRELGEIHKVEWIPFPAVCEKCKHLDCLCKDDITR